MNKIPTAEEFVKEFRKTDPIALAESIEHWIGQHCIEFAKLHVEAALKAASEKGEVYVEECMGQRTGATWVDEESILNSYPLTNIV